LGGEAAVDAGQNQDQRRGTQIIVEGSKFVSQDMVLPKGTSFAVKISFQYSVVIFFKVGYGGVPSYYR
jgi:hypothetical protein